jgi:hypothetical protein
VIENPILRAVAGQVGVDVDGVAADLDVERLIAGNATVKYRPDPDRPGEVLVEIVEDP